MFVILIITLLCYIIINKFISQTMLRSTLTKLGRMQRHTYLSQQPMILTRPFSFSWPCPRKLREIVKMSAFEKETAETCKLIWNEYHHAKPHTVSTVLSKSQYQQLMSNARSAPIFIFPVAKGRYPEHMVLVSQHQDESFVSWEPLLINCLNEAVDILERFPKGPCQLKPLYGHHLLQRADEPQGDCPNARRSHLAP